MPVIETGPDRMMERSRDSGLLVPLNGYRVYIYGASPGGLTLQEWAILKRFWTMYFSAAGAQFSCIPRGVSGAALSAVGSSGSRKTDLDCKFHRVHRIAEVMFLHRFGFCCALWLRSSATTFGYSLLFSRKRHPKSQF